ncbi:unnamed protein product (macronuclear) [Paramecium tetraurelia]|uniref:Peptidase S11 D-alanyl-D-alanine carboxypeptidase A N-terminal domain-containing protein n=1 Tax=Paramecium tetraurelia TaxID=5888 RepID=A0BHL3_PARTE|nr:uncharacterized protein GSPATT00029065001 [Paramecium tetraurelia]CAK58030.1 unnamed protein product [Paramecium tetraurelia]|eukprot:XP_001425428.1 hypothetical protein (macronuclear) [Paramecium tetraurelia strain d4-2]
MNQQYDDWPQWWNEVRRQKFGSETPPRRYEITVPSITAHTWVILDAQTGRLIWGKNEHSNREIASITKSMTAYVTIKICEQLKIDPTQVTVSVSEYATQIGGTSSNLQEGDSLTLLDLLHGLMLPSGNDSAQAIAENFGVYLYFQSKYFQQKIDSIDNDNNTIHVNNPAQYFVAEMNATAQKLGLSNTYFTNPHGLANRLNRSTAYDVAKLCYYAMKLPLFAQIVRTKEYSCTVTNLGQTRVLKWENTNKLLEQGFSGIKTGVTNDAGPCLASHFISRKHSYILVVLNCNSKEQRWVDSCRLIDWVTDIYEKQ